MSTTAPSAWQIETAMSVAMSLRQRLIDEDPDFANDEALLRDTLSGETDVYDLMRRLARFVLEAEGMVDAAKARMANLAGRKARYENRVSNARGALFAMLDALELRKFDDAEFVASIRAGSKATIITDEDALPDAYWRTTRSVDKSAIATALKAGETIPGAELSNGLPTLSLKAT